MQKNKYSEFKKYNIIIQTMAKDEEHIINEWITYHILLGIEHIYIFDDNSKIPISDTIKTLPDYIIEKITILRLDENDSNFFDAEFINSNYYNSNLYKKINNHKQIYFMNYFLDNYKKVSDWCFFCDCDEFLYLNNDINITIFLNKNNMYNIIYIPWLLYGSSYYIEQQNGLIIENFIYHEDKYCRIGKSIVKLYELDYIDDVHRLQYKNEKILYLNFNTKLFELPVHINHYQINSIKIYLKRKLRKEIGNLFGNIREASEIFNFMINYNDIKSNIMHKYTKQINLILKNTNYNTNYNVNNIEIDNDYLDIFEIDNNKYIYECDSYDLLYKILNSTNVRYCKKNKITKVIKDFDIDYYKYNNNDLSNLNHKSLIKHYLSHGKKEKRKYKFANIPNDFNPNIYIELNSDLKNMTLVEVKNHYENTGYKENRKYKYKNIPNDFDSNIYIELNFDLKNMTLVEVKNHYENIGYKENRKYSI